MNLKKPISAAMAAVMTLSVTATPALAAAEDPPGTATQADETEADATLGEQSSAEEDALNSSDTSEKSHQDAKVYASANGSYILTVPESINLHNVEKKDLGSGLYTNDKNCKVNLRGDVRQDQVVVVTVTEPVMQSEGSKDVDATVDTSSKTVWSRDDLFTGATAGEDGSYTEPTGVTTVYPVSAELTPGDWVGTAMFNCSLETVPSIVGAITGLETSNFDYDGNPHSPELKFSDGTTLEEGKDYTISGDTNKTEEGNYTITIKGAGKYVGTLTFNWTIKKQDISDAIIGLDSTAFEEDETSHAPTIKLKEGCNLQADVDYEVSGTTSATDAGDYKITITGKGKYKGTLDLEWKITSKPDIALAISGLSSTHFDYDGSEKAPELVFAEGYEDLVKDVDYTVSGTTSATNSGDYSITVSGIGRCKGTIKLDWNIRELIPVGGTYSVCKTKETLVGDGKTVYFPRYCDSEDTYVDSDYKYKYSVYGLWNVHVLETDKSSYGVIRSFICDKDVQTMNYTFQNCSRMIQSPDIPDTVRSMNYTFQNCASLERVPKIPDSVTRLYYTFNGCKALVEAPVIPDSVWDMDNTFQNCTSLVSAPEIPSNVTTMIRTFMDCTSLTKVSSVPDSVTNMSSTFQNCASLTEAPIIGNSVTNMYSTFSGCTSLTVAPKIPNSVTDMRYTFSNCTSLTGTPEIMDGVTALEYTFSGCTALVDISLIPNSITAMKGTFYKCTSLTEAPVIPDSVTDMSYTFSGCTSLVKAPVIPNKVTNMSGTFFGCTSLKTYAGSTSPDGNFADFVIPDCVENMGGTFSKCDCLVIAPIIPSLVTNMNSTFDRCEKLREAPVIPQGVVSLIGTFQNCRSLCSYAESINSDGDFSNYIIPDSVLYMGDNNDSGTFARCKSLVKPPVIGKNVANMQGTFVGCTKLVEAPMIPDSVTNMSSTFAGCTSLVEAPVIPSSIASMYSTFSGCTSLIETPIIPDSVTNINYTFRDCSALIKVSAIGNSVTSMYSTFEGCTSLIEAPTIPGNVTNMTSTFSGCTSLVEAPTIPNSVTIMGANWNSSLGTFSGCESLIAAPEIPVSVKNMDFTFNGCTSLTEAPVIPDSVTDMQATFYGCTLLAGTLICNANPTSYSNALKGTKITAIEGSCSDSTKTKLLATR